MTYPKKKEKLLDLSPNAYNYVTYIFLLLLINNKNILGQV